MADRLTRRQFVRHSTLTAAALAAGLAATRTVLAGNPAGEDTSQILNYSEQMEYRKCGKTGLLVSAIALGGHWKRVVKVIGGTEPEGWMTMDIDREDFQRNRREIVSHCIDRGINYVDACCREEILAYAKARSPDDATRCTSGTRGTSRRAGSRNGGPANDCRMDWTKACARRAWSMWTSAFSLLTDSPPAFAGGAGRCGGRARLGQKSGPHTFIGVSSHDRPHLKQLIEAYPDQVEVVLTPYTAKTKVVTDEDSLWASIQKHNVGWFGIKPFAGNSLFKGDSATDSPTAKADNEIAQDRRVTAFSATPPLPRRCPA